MLCCRLCPCLSHERLNALLPACGPFFFQSWIHCVKLKALPISHLEMMLNKLAITIASHVYQWWTGPPGHREKSRWAGPPEWVIFWPPGPLVHYNKLIKFRNV